MDDLFETPSVCCAEVDDWGGPFEARLEPDTTLPQLHVEHVSLERSGGRLLPWDPLTVAVSEGIPASILESAPSVVVTGDADAVAYHWRATEIVLRYRVLPGVDVPDTVSSPAWPPVLELARPGGAPTTYKLRYGALTDIPSIGWASEWTTAVFPIPAGSTSVEVGFRLGAEMVPEPGECAFGTISRVVVESIALR